jgi:diguanylate cyclase (GGDEF)-like protein/PAS domain S-box-containing protein
MNDAYKHSQVLHEATLHLLSLLASSRLEEDLLQRGLETLAAILQARYGAITLTDTAGKLQLFVHTGITPDEAALIGHPPQGRGLLGVTTPLCLDDISKDPRSIGFPHHHPPMKSLLSVNFSHDGKTYGRVYLSEKHDGSAFTKEDQQLLTRFADAFAQMLAYHRGQIELERNAKALSEISQALLAITGETFFRELVMNLGKALGVAFAFVGEVTDTSCSAIRTVAVNAGGKLAENFVYELPGTPCENVVGKDICSYARGVQQLFPDDRMLVEMGIESYIGSPLFNSAGKPIGILVLLDNKPLTDPALAEAILKICAGRAAAELDRRHQESALRESEERFRHLTELSSDWYWEQNDDFRFTLVTRNDKTAQRFYADQGLGKMRWELPYLDVPPAVWEAHKALLQAHQPFYDMVLKRKDAKGDIRIVSLSGIPLFDARGRFRGYRGIGRDITKHKRAEEEILMKAQLLDNTSESIFVIDMEGNILYANETAWKSRGYTRDELIKLNISTIDTPEHAKLIPSRMREVLEKGQLTFESAHYRKDGSVMPIEISARVFDWGGKKVFLSAMRDITLRVREDEARRSTLEALHTLHAITADAKLSFEEKIRKLLAMGCRRFNLPIGILARIENNCYEVMEVVAPDNSITRGSVYPLNLTYCSVTLKTNGPVSFEHAAKTEWKSHPCYTEFKLEAYLAVVIHVGGKPYGTLNFSSPEPRKLSFTDTDREILKLLAQWVGSELERRQADDALRASEASLVYAQHMAHIGNWERNIVTNEVRWSKEVDRIFGLDPQQSDPSFAVFLNAVHPDDRQNVIDTVNQAISEKRPYRNDFRVVHPDGTERIAHSEAEITFDDNGRAVYLFGTIQDVTERRQVQERLHYLAYYDSLTGLPNRQQVNDSLDRAMLEAATRERLVAVMFLDLDRFKNINDTLGHDVGDALLKEVAVRLKASLRPGDSISRLGGDEFILILGNIANINDVSRVAQKILDQFIPPFRIAGRDLFISPSVGITLYPFDDDNPENLLRNADIAMYRAKELGRNNFQFYTPELNVRAARRLELETGLRRALENEEFILHYQPLVNMQTGKITGMEALLRWQHPEFGLIPPMDFIPLAEETGLIVPIGEWVLRTACAQIKTWHATGFPAMHVAVNLSSVQLQQKNFADTVKKALRETGLEPQYLDLELTESLLMHDMEAVEKILKELKALGVLFSLDDFGTGYSSLSYLKRFPIDFLKIDRSFVNDINHDRYGAGIVRAIIVMAHTLGIKVIAEGVETAEQLEFLRAQECDITQGYFCSEPLATETFTDLLKDWQDIRMGKCSIQKATRKTRKKQTRYPKRPGAKRSRRP